MNEGTKNQRDQELTRVINVHILYTYNKVFHNGKSRNDCRLGNHMHNSRNHKFFTLTHAEKRHSETRKICFYVLLTLLQAIFV